MNSIWIIGTHPPCPRCKLLTNVVRAKINELGIFADVKHIAYTDTLSVEYAKTQGLKPGTVKDVAKVINQEIDYNRLAELLKNNTSKDTCQFKDYNDCNWSHELDEFLRPYENVAKEVGVMMTPVLIINGEIKHQGSVPDLTQIEKWLKEIKE